MPNTVQVAQLLELVASYLPKDDQAVILAAYTYAQTSHAGQQRISGEPYIIHPLATALTLAEYHLDRDAISAALLHDVPEDTGVTLREIKRQFGETVARLVDGVTKLAKVRLKQNWQASYRGSHTDHGRENFEAFERHVETLRKMFLAMSHDIRVVLIKLADRLNNMETLASLSPDKQRRIAQETLEVYAPLANRLGIGQLKGRLEDLAFPYAFPDDYTWLNHQIHLEIGQRQRSIERLRRILLKRLVAIGIRAEAHARTKHLYSLWKKLLRHDRDLGKIHDLVAARVIVPTVEDCYRALGLVHQMWKPLPGRIKDYIAVPKPNGYQSLHTTVFGLGGAITEIQIRTPDMHRWAELGIAAHWAFKEGDQPTFRHKRTTRQRPVSRDKLVWIKELAKLHRNFEDPTEWTQNLQLDFFEHRIFVFTPHGDVLDLPTGATPIDFAFAVHSDLGRHCIGAKVNGKLVPLSYPLGSGDIVEILLNKKNTPKQDWLRFIKTNRARTLIKRDLQMTSAALDKSGGSRV